MIRIAVVGTGNIANAHLRAWLRQSGRCAVTALADVIPGKAEKMRSDYGLEAFCTEDYRELLRQEDVDLVDVCAPPFLHAEVSVAALRAGKHVVCEKPMAASLAECDEMLKARDESGKLLSVIAQNRFHKPIRDLKALLDSGLAGPVRSVQVDSFWWRGHSYYDLWWRGTWEKEGGGCTLNHAVHHIDMLCWMMGLPEKVTSVLANVGHDNAQVEDLSVSILQYPGALGQLTASVVHHGEEQQLVFQCEKARVSAPFRVFASVEKPNGFPVRNEALESELAAFADGLPPLPLEGHDGQLADVLDALEQGRPCAVGGEDGRRTIELITAVFKSGALGQTVTLPLLPDDPFYTAEGILGAMPRFHEKSVSALSLEGDITLGSSYR